MTFRFGSLRHVREAVGEWPLFADTVEKAVKYFV
jgi:hypothetical protein